MLQSISLLPSRRRLRAMLRNPCRYVPFSYFKFKRHYADNHAPFRHHSPAPETPLQERSRRRLPHHPRGRASRKRRNRKSPGAPDKRFPHAPPPLHLLDRQLDRLPHPHARVEGEVHRDVLQVQEGHLFRLRLPDVRRQRRRREARRRIGVLIRTMMLS
jgi:hypothetical protein